MSGQQVATSAYAVSTERMTAINTHGIIRQVTDTLGKLSNADVRLFLIWMIYWGDDMIIVLILMGVMTGFLIGYAYGLCQMDSLHHRVKSQEWRGNIPLSNKTTPKPLHPHK